jgi:hypothetical protein
MNIRYSNDQDEELVWKFSTSNHEVLPMLLTLSSIVLYIKETLIK